MQARQTANVAAINYLNEIASVKIGKTASPAFGQRGSDLPAALVRAYDLEQHVRFFGTINSPFTGWGRRMVRCSPDPSIAMR